MIFYFLFFFFFLLKSMFIFFFFFFSSRRRHTRLQGDWSSDVCSSDLPCGRPGEPGFRSIPGMGRSRRPWRSLIQRALSVLFIGLLSCSAPFCPARAHCFVSNPPMIWPNGDVVVVLKL